VFYFVLCNDLILYGEEMAGIFTKNSKQRYKFHREILLSDLRIVLPHNDAKSFIMIGLDKGLDCLTSSSSLSLTSVTAFEVEASSTEECSTWIQLLIELKTAKSLHVHRTSITQCAPEPIRVIKFWQVDSMVGSVRLVKYSIPDSLDHDSGIISMEDLVPLEDEVGFENYRDSLSMSSLTPTSSVNFERNLSTLGIRSRGDSSLPPATNSGRINSNMRSKSLTSSTSSGTPTPNVFDQGAAAPAAQVFDIFAGEMLVPCSEPFVTTPPQLHTVWSADFEEGEANRRSFPRPASSPDFRSSLGMAELTNHDQVERSRLPPSHDLESAFLPKSVLPQEEKISPKAFPPRPQFQPPPPLPPRPQFVPPPPPSFAGDDDLFEFLTSDTRPATTGSSTATSHRGNGQPTKKVVLDESKYILHRK
jgi:hypothetical protein